MRKTVTFTARTLEVSERIARSDSYKVALARAGGGEETQIAAGSESARLRQLADIGAHVVVRLTEDAGYRQLAQLYSDEGDVYKSFQDRALTRRSGEEEDQEGLDHLFEALSDR